jgi:hypothetical protein
MNTFSNDNQPLYTIRNNSTDPRIVRKNIATTETEASSPYYILNYKNISPTDTAIPEGISLEEFPERYNSVIFDTVSNAPISIAPSEPIPLDEFIQKYPTITDEIYVSEITEGTLIQLFYNERSEEWEIGTRSSIGGHNRHYRTEYPGFCLQKQKTFRQMFYDALLQITPKDQSDRSEENRNKISVDLVYNPEFENYHLPLSEIPFIKTLSKLYCYNFVLSHPSNPLVNPSFYPKLTLVAVFEINRVLGSRNEFHTWMIPPYYVSTIIPKEYRRVVAVQDIYLGWKGESLYEKMSQHVFSCWKRPGLMVTNIQTGERAMLENPHYRYVVELRGNHTNFQYQYFELCKSHRLNEFLEYFPGFKDLFVHFYNQYMEFTFRVYSVYIHYFVNKQRDHLIVPEYHNHATKIFHTMVKPTLMPGQRNLVVTHELVQHYFDQMPTAKIVGILSKIYV